MLFFILGIDHSCWPASVNSVELLQGIKKKKSLILMFSYVTVNKKPLHAALSTAVDVNLTAFNSCTTVLYENKTTFTLKMLELASS